MKRLCTIFFIAVLTIFLASNVNGQSDEFIKWHHIERAQELMTKDPKPIFIEFTAAWCGWCKKMEKTTFREKEIVGVLNEDFYAVKIDFDSRVEFQFGGESYTAKKMAKEFGVEGLPTMVLVSEDLSDHTLIVGYQKGKQLRARLSKSVND